MLEGTWGLTQGNQLGNVPISPGDGPRQRRALGNFPRLYPNNGLVPVGSYQEKVLQEMNAPFFHERSCRDARRALRGADASRMRRRTVRIYPTFLCMQNTKDLAVSLTKLWGSHTFKVGYQSQDSLKLQNLGTVTQGALPFEGRVSFAERQQQPARYRVRVLERRDRRLPELPAAERALRGRLPLPQQRFLRSGQLEDDAAS